MCNLAYAYYHGCGSGINYRLAVRWYRKAAARGDAKAMWNLGLAYEEGKGVRRNLTVAREWWRRAAKAGNRKAKRKLLSI